VRCCTAAIRAFANNEHDKLDDDALRSIFVFGFLFEIV